MTLETQLIRDEGKVLHVYLDSLGIRTAGVGHNLEAHGIDLPVGAGVSEEQCMTWLQQDIADVREFLSRELPWIVKLEVPRQAVLENMAFNLREKLLGFHNTFGLIQQGKYLEASEEMLKSRWATQVGARAHRLAKQLQENVWV